MLDPVLAADDVTVTRDGDPILDTISVSVSSRESVLIRGRSGAGKTTLFSVLGLLERPDAGTITVAGTATEGLSEKQRARLRRESVGIIFQDFKLIPDLTARENVAVPMEHTGTVDEDWLTTLLKSLNLTPLADRLPPTLSGGERQRVAIARALANQPAVLLADEPTGQLDPETSRDVMELLVSCREEFGTALVAVSHDTAFANEFNRVLSLQDGTLIRKDE